MELQETKVKCQNKDHSGKLRRVVRSQHLIRCVTPRFPDDGSQTLHHSLSSMIEFGYVVVWLSLLNIRKFRDESPSTSGTRYGKHFTSTLVVVSCSVYSLHE